MRICLDTSAYVNYRRGYPDVNELIDRADWIGIPTVVLGELEAGFRLGTRFTDNKSKLDAFMNHPFVKLLDITHHVAEIYGDIFAQQRLTGKPIPTNDMWIASTTASAGATLITFDKQFALVSRIGTICL